jgi:CRISPR-associated protein Csd1
MLLQRLCEYADLLDDLPPPMYQYLPVRYLISLEEDGRPEGEVLDRKTPTNKRGPAVLVPDLKRTVAISPKLLVDNAEYVLGIPRAESKPERVQVQHARFVALAQACAAATSDWRVAAIVRFLTEFRHQLILTPDFDPAENIMFEVDRSNPVTSPAVQAFWAKEAAAGNEDLLMQCLVCGQMRPPVERLPISVKGGLIPGGQTSGMALISANAPAFESYGLEASLIAPTCEACGQRFGNALNRLLSQDDTRLRIGPVVHTFWAKEPAPFSVVTLLSTDEPDQVRHFLSAAWRSKPEAARMDVTPFYAITLTASGARVAVRDWLETTLGKAQLHLERYFHLQSMRDPEGTIRYLPLLRLAQATINSKSQREEPTAQTVEALLHMALHGGPLPNGVLYQVVRRVRSEQHVLLHHAALIKMVLASQERIGAMTELDPANRTPAYLCGRLLSVLESIQGAALGKVNATIVDRYYGTASSAPASVYGRLVRGAQPHLAKLRRDKPGAFRRLDVQLQEILSGFQDRFPSTLNLQQQGLFALGYYHQRTADIHAGKVAAEAKKRGALPPAEAGMEDLAE